MKEKFQTSELAMILIVVLSGAVLEVGSRPRLRAVYSYACIVAKSAISLSELSESCC